jgi:hypothetical protein
MRMLAADRHGDVGLPEFGMVVGNDHRSAGASAWLWTPSAGEHASYTNLGGYRWTERVGSGGEAVQIALRLLQKVAVEHGWADA